MLIRQNTSSIDRSASAVAAELCDEWRHIKRALAPIIGQRGISAVFNHALYLASLQYPFLTVVKDDLLTSNFAALERALSKEATDLALAANSHFFKCFQELMSHLIGESLTSRLLASIPASSFNLELPLHEHFVQIVGQPEGVNRRAGE